MTLEALLAGLHIVAILSLVVFLSSQAALCRSEWMNPAVVRRLSRLDMIYGMTAVAVLLTFFPRYVGLFGERLLAECKPDQVVVSLAHSSLFNEVALARALSEGPLAAAWFDSLEPGALDPGRPLRHIDTLQVTPRVSGTTQQSRTRSAWAVAQRIDEIVLALQAREEFSETLPGGFSGFGDDPQPA